MNRLLNKLLSRNMSVWQMAGFVLANLFGMAIVLLAVQFAHDVIPMFTGGDSFMRPGQMVVVKRVNTLRTVTGSAPTFRQREVEELREQPFVNDIGAFVASQYNVYATIGLGDMKMSTEMFFEAVPDKYIDVNLDRWHYRTGSDTLPIILPQNYLNLYNFGFATSKGLPAISADLVRQVPVSLRLRGWGGKKVMTGRVVGFSKTLNTILVPMNFMEETNRELAPDVESPQPSRLLVEVNNPGDDRISKFLEENNYDTEGHDADASKTASFLRTLVGIVLAVGIVITALAFYVLLLSIFLLLQKHTYKIDTLLLMGYSPGQVARPFHLLAISLNVVVFLVALVIVRVLRKYYLARISGIYPGMEEGSLTPAILAGLFILAIVAVLNFTAIRRKVVGVWHLHE
ncbi:MAG: ABC transporter permease [Prevotella sp.]|nr:ABC transporter permease [Prevotella sp.]